MLTALPAAQSSPPSRLHPARRQGRALLPRGSGTALRRAPGTRPSCPRGDVPEAPLQHRHSPCSLRTGTRRPLSSRGPALLWECRFAPASSKAGPCVFAPWGAPPAPYITSLLSPHRSRGVRLPLPSPDPRGNSCGQFPHPRKPGSPSTAAIHPAPGMAPQEPAALSFPLTSRCIPGPRSLLWRPGQFPVSLPRGTILPRVGNLPGIVIAVCWVTSGRDRDT